MILGYGLSRFLLLPYYHLQAARKGERELEPISSSSSISLCSSHIHTYQCLLISRLWRKMMAAILLLNSAITVLLNLALICFPLVSVLALYRADHFNSFLFFFLESIFCFAVSFSARKQHMSQSAVIRSWPPFQTKINTAHLRLFPPAHMPLKFFLCVSQMETCRACASQEVAADACPEHLETCSEHQGACILLSWLSFLCTFQN